MWKLSLFLFLYFNLTVLCAWTSVRPEGGVYKWQNSFRAPFGSTRVAFWEGNGRAQVEERGVRLTTNEPNTFGTWFNTKPLFDKEWEFRLSFAIGSEQNQGGKGIVLWVVKEKPSAGDFYGFSNVWNGLALVFDTERDDPMIYAVKNDNSFNFEGNLEQHSLGSCSASLRQLTNSVDKVTSLLIRYKDQQLLVSHDLSAYTDAEYGWTDCFNVPITLSPDEDYYLGLSASTGLNADNHFVNMLTTWGLDKRTSQPNNQQTSQQTQNQQQEQNKQEEQKQQDSNQQNQNQDQQDQNQDQQTQDQQDQDQQDQNQDQQTQDQQAQDQQQALDQQVQNQQAQEQQDQNQQPPQDQQTQGQQNQNINPEQNGLKEKIQKRFTDLEQFHNEYSQKFNTKADEFESRIKRYGETVNTQRVRLGDLARNSKPEDSGTELDRGVKFLASEIEKLKQALTRLEDTINSKNKDTEWLAGNQENLGEKLHKAASGSGYSMWPVLIGIQVLAILIYVACKKKRKTWFTWYALRQICL